MFNKSEQINELATALSKFQGEVEDAVKDTQGYGYKYAQLSGVLEISRPLLTKYGLSISQGCDSEVDINHHYGEGDKKPSINTTVRIDTLLMHSSGQWISSEIGCAVGEMKGATQVQALGAIISYLRRYSYAAILCITQVDDDAAGTGTVTEIPAKPKLSSTHSMLLQKIIDLKITEEQQKAWLTKFNVDRIELLSVENAAQIMGRLNARAAVKTVTKEGEVANAV